LQSHASWTNDQASGGPGGKLKGWDFEGGQVKRNGVTTIDEGGIVTDGKDDGATGGGPECGRCC
jgi:hypothetical protein